MYDHSLSHWLDLKKQKWDKEVRYIVSSVMYSCSLLLTVRTKSRDVQGEEDEAEEEEDIQHQNDKDR